MTVIWTTEAVVVRVVRYGERDAILTLLTETGLVTAMARGGARSTGRLSAAARLCAQGTYVLYQGRGMGDVRQAEIARLRRAVHEDVVKAAYAAYLCDLASRTVPERPDAPPAAYRQFVSVLDGLEADRVPADVLARAFELKVCAWLGVAPDWRRCIRCGAEFAQAGGELRYDPREGGLICGECVSAVASDVTRAWPVPRKIAAVLHLLTYADIAKLHRVDLSGGMRDSLSRILAHQLREFAGVGGRARQVLDDIVASLPDAPDDHRGDLHT
ncbi:DNA repair protein RecO [Alicyclobacillus mali]|uniref:DNA repair protein RecO n=1 Tax=Alicyclobacillus mali (ex Roth et al. 2021) TaxID=1123961 RepID=A0ABS0F4N5_9BACL|nr:DNA repair protein RecO [Alicyclobacillus mali (ex Roth et al. 2021)]MBF8378266.1 DNA repair protein RecO [Alicyclobacillus mali (ex Roth et al. 2021)]MCL6487850.1 DNA repair protein RecO [Alicyclobacillus mali (ex Roth et al. 2021)]